MWFGAMIVLIWPDWCGLVLVFLLLRPFLQLFSFFLEVQQFLQLFLFVSFSTFFCQDLCASFYLCCLSCAFSFVCCHLPLDPYVPYSSLQSQSPRTQSPNEQHRAKLIRICCNRWGTISKQSSTEQYCTKVQ